MFDLRGRTLVRLDHFQVMTARLRTNLPCPSGLHFLLETVRGPATSLVSLVCTPLSRRLPFRSSYPSVSPTKRVVCLLTHLVSFSRTLGLRRRSGRVTSRDIVSDLSDHSSYKVRNTLNRRTSDIKRGPVQTKSNIFYKKIYNLGHKHSIQ